MSKRPNELRGKSPSPDQPGTPATEATEGQSVTDRTRLRTPYADVLPPLSTEEFEALRADIRRYGVRMPILVDEAGNILDGHHRHKIDPNAPRALIEGLTEPQKEKTFPIAEPTGKVS